MRTVREPELGNEIVYTRHVAPAHLCFGRYPIELLFRVRQAASSVFRPPVRVVPPAWRPVADSPASIAFSASRYVLGSPTLVCVSAQAPRSRSMTSARSRSAAAPAHSRSRRDQQRSYSFSFAAIASRSGRRCRQRQDFASPVPARSCGPQATAKTPRHRFAVRTQPAASPNSCGTADLPNRKRCVALEALQPTLQLLVDSVTAAPQC